MGLAAGSRLGPYLILSEVAAGGMGEVYRARDAKLDRDVAIKVLPEAVAKDPDALARFEREAKAIAALSHPNILTIHDFGTDKGITYAVMELLEGETLRSRLAPGRIPPKEAVDYGVQIARGLAAAHERGVVHRDLKPENLFLARGGHLKILDFGLAKRREAVGTSEETSAPTASLQTDPGRVMGTIGYMSPEQVAGEAVDTRTDIFSLGAVLYEMLSGKRAFSRSTASQTIAAILKDDPPDLSNSRPDISPQLEHVVRHCLEKDRNRRFQSADDIAFALTEASGPSTVSPVSFRTRSAASGRVIVAAAIIAVLAATGLIVWRQRRATPATDKALKRVAVLPFENLGSPDDDYFADGMADAVRGKLTSLRGIEVIARGSSVGYKKSGKTPAQIARELDAPYLLTATVRWQKTGESSRVQVTPELVLVKESRAPASRWQQPFDAQMTDVFQVQSDIATQVARELGVALSDEQKKELSQRPTQNLAAYDAYLKGIEEQGRFYFKEARQSFEKALELDPSFAMAMLGLARQSTDDEQRIALVKRAASEKTRLTERERLHVELALALAEERLDDAAQIAREIHRKYPDDQLAATILSAVEFGRGHVERAVQIQSELLAVDPRNSAAYNQIAYYYGYNGDYERAVENLKKYAALEIGTANPYDSLGEIQSYSGRYNEAIANLNRALAIKPDFVASIGHLGVAYEGLGEYAKAIAAYEKAAEVSEDPGARRGYLVSAMRAAFYAKDSKEVLRLCELANATKSDSKNAAVEKGLIDAVKALAQGRPSESKKILLGLQEKLEASSTTQTPSLARQQHFSGFNVLMALALEGQGKPAEALEYWKKNAYPPSPFENFEQRQVIYEARAKVAVGLARAGDLDGAEKLIAENHKWNPSWAPTKPDELEVERLRLEKSRSAAR